MLLAANVPHTLSPHHCHKSNWLCIQARGPLAFAPSTASCVHFYPHPRNHTTTPATHRPAAPLHCPRGPGHREPRRLNARAVHRNLEEHVLLRRPRHLMLVPIWTAAPRPCAESPKRLALRPRILRAVGDTCIARRRHLWYVDGRPGGPAGGGEGAAAGCDTPPPVRRAGHRTLRARRWNVTRRASRCMPLSRATRIS